MSVSCVGSLIDYNAMLIYAYIAHEEKNAFIFFLAFVAQVNAVFYVLKFIIKLFKTLQFSKLYTVKLLN